MDRSDCRSAVMTVKGHGDLPTAPLLDHSDETRRLKKRDALVIENLQIVGSVLQAWLPKLPHSIEAEDLWSAGVIGLIDAAQKYDSTRSVRFRTYAEVRVQGAIRDYLRSLSWAPRGLHRRKREIEATRSAIEKKTGRSITASELGETLGLSSEEQHRILMLIERIDLCNVDAICEQENALSYHKLKASTLDDPLLNIEREELTALLGLAIEALPERQRVILWLYYYEDLTMKEIGTKLGVNEARISQLHSKAISVLRQQMKPCFKPWRLLKRVSGRRGGGPAGNWLSATSITTATGRRVGLGTLQ
jgi:RNA polymerase sigma factor FliA